MNHVMTTVLNIGHLNYNLIVSLSWLNTAVHGYGWLNLLHLTYQDSKRVISA